MKFLNCHNKRVIFVVFSIVILFVVTLLVNNSLYSQVSSTSKHRIHTEAREDLYHPTTPFHRRGHNFDASVSREYGVILCLFDGVLSLGLSLMRELRCLGNHELVQVYYCGSTELSNTSIELILELDNRVEFVDACSDLVSQGVMSLELSQKIKSWWIKPLALYHTDIRHVMLVDADDFILKNPAVVRNLDGYIQTGTTFFYDRVIATESFLISKDSTDTYVRNLFRKFDYARFNVSEGYNLSAHITNSLAYQGKTAHEMDSSMVFIDKKRAGQTVMDVIFWFITEEHFRFEYSWGDKETFWLAFELTHAPYFFSPWGASVVNSVSNNDMSRHPNSLCGSILHFMPINNIGHDENEAEVLYVNAKALIDPYPEGVNHVRVAYPNNLFNMAPTHMTPRQQRKVANETKFNGRKFYPECLVEMGSTPLPDCFNQHLLRRRHYFFGVVMGVRGPLRNCEM